MYIIIVCTVQCLQAVRHVTVPGRGRPTTRVRRDRECVYNHSVCFTMIAGWAVSHVIVTRRGCPTTHVRRERERESIQS